MSNLNYIFVPGREKVDEIEMPTLNDDQRGNLSNQTNAIYSSLPVLETSDEIGYKKTKNRQKKWEKIIYLI